MKKLDKMTLDELAKEMPVLSEAEQRQSVGGTVYCNLSGAYLGKVGLGDDLRFCSLDDYKQYSSGGIEGGGVNFASLNREG